MANRPKDDAGEEARIATASLEVRYEKRFDIAIKIEVTGINRGGQVFHERTLTRDVSEWGCAFLLSVEVREDDIISLRVIPPERKEGAPARHVAFQVVRARPKNNGWFVAAWKMENTDLWGAQLQKMNNREEAGSKIDKDEAAMRAKRRPKDAD